MLWKPNSVQLFSYIHNTSGLPWWATIVAVTFSTRILLFPLFVYQQKVASRCESHERVTLSQKKHPKHAFQSDRSSPCVSNATSHGSECHGCRRLNWWEGGFWRTKSLHMDLYIQRCESASDFLPQSALCKLYKYLYFLALFRLQIRIYTSASLHPTFCVTQTGDRNDSSCTMQTFPKQNYVGTLVKTH